MRRRELLAAALTLALAGSGAALAAPLAPDDQALVERAAAYLDGLDEAKGHFVQTDSRGQTSEGEVYLDRPGRARFEYTDPPTLLVVADGRTVTVLNRRLHTLDHYPLGSTPLALFLQKHVRLDKLDVTSVQRYPGAFAITGKGGGRGMHGQITLTFFDNPVRLEQWSILDAQGARTTVRLSDFQPTHGLDPELFTLGGPSPGG